MLATINRRLPAALATPLFLALLLASVVAVTPATVQNVDADLAFPGLCAGGRATRPFVCAQRVPSGSQAPETEQELGVG